MTPHRATSRMSQVENLFRSCRAARRSREKFDAIAETSQVADHLARSHLLRLGADRRPAFLVPYALVQDLPDQSTQPVSDGTDRLRILEAGTIWRYTMAKIVPLAFTAALAA